MAVEIRCFLWFFPFRSVCCIVYSLSSLFHSSSSPCSSLPSILEIWFIPSCHAWQNFHFLFGSSFSASFPFCMVSVERLIPIATQSSCKMFRLCFIAVCFLLTICQSCRLIVPAELLNGCIFDPMIVSVSHAGFSINRDNCNTAIAKHVFAEQPLVYYGRAKSVIFLMLSSDQSKCFAILVFINF